MPFLGNTPAESYIAFAKQDITGNGGTSYSLNHSVTTAADIELFVNNVQQEPTEAYTVSGSTLTLSEAIASTDDCYCIFRGRSVGTISPPDGSVTSAKLATNLAIGGTLDVGTIRAANGTTAATIDTGGRIVQPTKPVFRVVKRSSSGGGGRSGDLDFNEVPINVGGHWDSTNHYFVAPIDGYYQFNFVGFGSDSNGTSRTAGSNVAAGLFKYTGGAWIDESETYYYAASTAAYVNMSFSHITHLAVNERVKMNVRIGYVYYDDSTRDYIVFSGFLIG